jgi:hypothetical protein
MSLPSIGLSGAITVRPLLDPVFVAATMAAALRKGNTETTFV